MKIKLKQYGSTKTFYSIEDLFEYMLDGSDHGLGELESLNARGNNNSNAIGRLVSVLYEKKILNKKDILKILMGYVNDDDKLIILKKVKAK